MSTYAAGFEAGERQAFADRRTNAQRATPVCWSDYDRGWSDYDRGYRDGYTPRSSTWWLRVSAVTELRAKAAA